MKTQQQIIQELKDIISAFDKHYDESFDAIDGYDEDYAQEVQENLSNLLHSIVNFEDEGPSDNSIYRRQNSTLCSRIQGV